MNHWSPEQIETLRRMWGKGESSGQIAKVVGKTRNAVMGMVNRQGLIGMKGLAQVDEAPNEKSVEPSVPENHIPEVQAPEIVASEVVVPEVQALQIPSKVEFLKESIVSLYAEHVNEDDIEIIQILAAAVVFETTNHKDLAEMLEIDEEITAKVRDDMIAAELWSETDAGDLKRYEGKEGFLQFILEAMLYEDQIAHADGRWSMRDAVKMPTLSSPSERVLEAIM